MATSIKVGLHVTSTSDAFVFYADEYLATAGQSETPAVVGSPLLEWREEGDNILLKGTISNSDRSLHVRGMGLLSSVSSGSDTMEIDQFQARLLINTASALWFQQDIDQLDVADLNAAQRRYTHFQNLVNQGHGGMAPLALFKGPAGVRY